MFHDGVVPPSNRAGEAVPPSCPTLLRKTAQVTAQDNELPNKELLDLAAAFGLPATQATAQVAAQVVKILQAAVDPVNRNLL